MSLHSRHPQTKPCMYVELESGLESSKGTGRIDDDAAHNSPICGLLPGHRPHFGFLPATNISDSQRYHKVPDGIHPTINTIKDFSSTFTTFTTPDRPIKELWEIKSYKRL